MAMTKPETDPDAPPIPEVETAKCDSCGFTEDCTIAYITRIRDRYQGRWICGLCIEAVKDEVLRSDTLITVEEALNRHINVFRKFQNSSPLTQTEHPISAFGRLFRRSLDSPRTVRSNSSNSLPSMKKINGSSSSLIRSESCFSSLSLRKTE